MSDLDLLYQYARKHSEDAFATLLQRHLDLVYSAALRQVRSPQLAEEVAQSVFTDLAQQAGKLKPDTILTAWLYQVTRRTAVDERNLGVASPFSTFTGVHFIGCVLTHSPTHPLSPPHRRFLLRALALCGRNSGFMLTGPGGSTNILWHPEKNGGEKNDSGNGRGVSRNWKIGCRGRVAQRHSSFKLTGHTGCHIELIAHPGI